MATPVTPLPFVKPQFFDANGDPLAGGFIYTYDAGTLTPKATYTDSTGVTVNPNPVELDAGGFAEIWLAAGDYKVAAEDSAHVPQWTVDGVPGFQTLAFLQDPGSNGIVVRTAAGTTIARSIIGTAGRIAVSNGSGVGANPQVDIGASVALVDVENAWADDLRQTFNPGANKAGINVGASAAEPLVPVNGDLFYDSNTNELKARINGAWVVLQAVIPPPPTPTDGIAKGWLVTDGVGTWNILESFNVSSITDLGTGDFRVNWTIPFVGSYVIVGSCIDNTATTVRIFQNWAGLGECIVMDAAGSLADPTSGVSLAAFGRQ